MDSYYSTPTTSWRPIAEHDGSDTPVDLWRDGERLVGYRWKGRWEKPHGYPVSINVLTRPPSHFMPVPAPPEGCEAEPS